MSRVYKVEHEDIDTKDAAEVKNCVASSIPQELRSLSSTIMDMAHLLTEDPLTDEQHSYISYILQSTNRLLSLADNLSAASHISIQEIPVIEPREPSVLMVEDNHIIQFVHKKMLTELNCRVDVASSAEQALDMPDTHYDLILLDIELPGKSGIDVAIELRKREHFKHIKMVALTSFVEDGMAEKCLAAGINQVFSKPIDIKKLGSLIYGNNRILKANYF